MYWFHGQQQIEKIVSAYNLISVFLFLCSLRLKRMSSTTRFYLVFGRCHCLNIEKISLRPAIANRAETTPIHQSKDHQSHTTRMEAIVKKIGISLYGKRKMSLLRCVLTISVVSVCSYIWPKQYFRYTHEPPHILTIAHGKSNFSVEIALLLFKHHMGNGNHSGYMNWCYWFER